MLTLAILWQKASMYNENHITDFVKAAGLSPFLQNRGDMIVVYKIHACSNAVANLNVILQCNCKHSNIIFTNSIQLTQLAHSYTQADS
jgi:hypothetical protein